jgi:hypothetical protein
MTRTAGFGVGDHAEAGKCRWNLQIPHPVLFLRFCPREDNGSVAEDCIMTTSALSMTAYFIGSRSTHAGPDFMDLIRPTLEEANRKLDVTMQMVFSWELESEQQKSAIRKADLISVLLSDAPADPQVVEQVIYARNQGKRIIGAYEQGIYDPHEMELEPRSEIESLCHEVGRNDMGFCARFWSELLLIGHERLASRAEEGRGHE